jgi:membrane protein DedA with SNARE-associated domain
MNELTQFLTGYGTPVLFAIVFVEQAGLPLPSAPWLLAAGALSATGKISPALVIGVTALAAVMADSLWFYVGRRGGERVLRVFCRLSFSRNTCVGRTKDLFTRHGFKALVAAKFLPGLGTVMPPLAGALGMSTGRFLFFDALGSLFYGTFYTTAGFLFRKQLQQALDLLHRLGLTALLLLLAVVGGYVVFKYAHRRKPPVTGRSAREPAARTEPAGIGVSIAAEGWNPPHLQTMTAVTGLPSQNVRIFAEVQREKSVPRRTTVPRPIEGAPRAVCNSISHIGLDRLGSPHGQEQTHRHPHRRRR